MPLYSFMILTVVLFLGNFLALLNVVEGQKAVNAVMEFAKFHLLENDFTITGRPSQETKHTLVFAIKQNTERIESILFDVSDPRNANYGQHLTREQVSERKVILQNVLQNILQNILKKDLFKA